MVWTMHLPQADDPPPFDFDAALTVRDRDGRRVAAMALAVPIATILLTAPLAIALAAFGDGQVFAVGPGPQLARSAAFVAQVAASLAALALAVLICAWAIFRRPLRSWITAAPRFRWPLLAWAAAYTCIGVAVLMAAEALFRGAPEMPIFQADAGAGLRLAYALAALLGFLVAAAAEEVIFRGYLLQQIRAFVANPWVAVAGSAAVFALFHLEFDPVALIARFLAGAAFAWAVLRLGGLEFAIGAHLGVNLMIALVQAPLLPEDVPVAGRLEDVALEILLALYIAAGAEIARRDRRLTLAPAISSPA
ncbi:MAG: lysostaphin resistance A-like protein [Phenylobacterium sp.]|uniref:CPBP family intramembrane glutamic endopeptidase n=1 Tax=Phenylobacterium sp. TaxID=1871053 RepID=UPI003919334B